MRHEERALLILLAKGVARLHERRFIEDGGEAWLVPANEIQALVAAVLEAEGEVDQVERYRRQIELGVSL